MKLHWVPSSLASRPGPARLDIDGTSFELPPGSSIKFRQGVVWVLRGKSLAVISRFGQLLLSDAESRRLAERWVHV